MEKDDLIKSCRYYDGKDTPDENIQGDARILYDWEASWVRFQTNQGDKGILTSILEEYTSVGLGDLQPNDGVPITLKAVLFNRFGWHNSAPMEIIVQEFREFYKTLYPIDRKENRGE